MYINTNLGAQIREAFGSKDAPGVSKSAKKKETDILGEAADVSISASQRETATVNQDSRLNGVNNAKEFAARLRERLTGNGGEAMAAQGNVRSHAVANLLAD